MKITAGMGTLEQFERYAEAGADELFCGFVPFEWLEKYGVLRPLNRREVLLYPTQVASWTDMRLLARMSERAGVPIAVTVNSMGYAPEQYAEIEAYICRLMDMGYERFILADLALMMHIRARGIGCKLHLSGETGEFSRNSLALLSELRPARVIFHRKVSPEEMKSCMAALPDAEAEAFVLNERCYYTGAMCASLHCDEMAHLCRLSGRIGGIRETVSDVTEADFAAEDGDMLGGTGCGLCALPMLRRAGITHLKLVGRGNHTERMVRDIRALRTALSLPEENYESEMKRRLFPDGCSGACYYGKP